MYSVSDIVEMGAADKLILSHMKEVEQIDDLEPQSMYSLECFDE